MTWIFKYNLNEPVSLWRPEFDLSSIHVKFVVENLALGQVFLQVLQFSPVSNIPPTRHTRLPLHVALTGKTNEESLGTFQKSMLFSETE
jgi:hypothetical protein